MTESDKKKYATGAKRPQLSTVEAKTKPPVETKVEPPVVKEDKNPSVKEGRGTQHVHVYKVVGVREYTIENCTPKEALAQASEAGVTNKKWYPAGCSVLALIPSPEVAKGIPKATITEAFSTQDLRGGVK